jgi:hypothetical protein
VGQREAGVGFSHDTARPAGAQGKGAGGRPPGAAARARCLWLRASLRPLPLQASSPFPPRLDGYARPHNALADVPIDKRGLACGGAGAAAIGAGAIPMLPSAPVQPGQRPRLGPPQLLYCSAGPWCTPHVRPPGASQRPPLPLQLQRLGCRRRGRRRRRRPPPQCTCRVVADDHHTDLPPRLANLLAQPHDGVARD